MAQGGVFGGGGGGGEGEGEGRDQLQSLQNLWPLQPLLAPFTTPLMIGFDPVPHQHSVFSCTALMEYMVTFTHTCHKANQQDVVRQLSKPAQLHNSSTACKLAEASP